MDLALGFSTDPKERRRLQNRLAQRKFRGKCSDTLSSMSPLAVSLTVQSKFSERRDQRDKEDIPGNTKSSDFAVDAIHDDGALPLHFPENDDWSWDTVFPALPTIDQIEMPISSQRCPEDREVTQSAEIDARCFGTFNASPNAEALDQPFEVSSSIGGYYDLGQFAYGDASSASFSNRRPHEIAKKEAFTGDSNETLINHQTLGSHQIPHSLTSHSLPGRPLGPRENANTQSEIVKENLLQEDATTESGWLKALHIAAKKGHERIVDVLIERLPNCNEKDSDGRTALMYAVIADHTSVVNQLLAHGARVNDVDNERRSVLHWAVLHRRESILMTLLRHHRESGSELDLNTCDSAGLTPLHMAVEKGLEQVVIVLLRWGADLHSRARK